MSGNNPDRGTSTDRGTAPDWGTLYLDRRRLIRIKVASGKHLFLWYNSNCDWQRCRGITMKIWAIFVTPVTPFQFMGLSLTTWQSGCPFQKEWKPYISSHIFNLMATRDDKQYFHLTLCVASRGLRHNLDQNQPMYTCVRPPLQLQTAVAKRKTIPQSLSLFKIYD